MFNKKGIKVENSNVLFGMKCPQCGSLGPFDIVGSCVFHVDDNGIQDYNNTEWDSTSPCYCKDCDCEGDVFIFMEKNQVARNNHVDLSDQELNQCLAALRLWQEYFKDTPVDAHADKEHFEETPAMSNKEIDGLCMRFNLGPIPLESKTDPRQELVDLIASMKILPFTKPENPEDSYEYLKILTQTLEKLCLMARSIKEGK